MPKLQYFAAGTKVEIPEGSTGPKEPLLNRRVWSIYMEKPQPVIKHLGTPNPKEKVMESLVQAPYIYFEAPMLWLSINRWPFLPKSESDLSEGYVCPDGVKLRVEEDIARFYSRAYSKMTNMELLEYFYRFRKRFNRDTAVNYLLFRGILEKWVIVSPPRSSFSAMILDFDPCLKYFWHRTMLSFGHGRYWEGHRLRYAAFKKLYFKNLDTYLSGVKYLVYWVYLCSRFPRSLHKTKFQYSSNFTNDLVPEFFCP